MPYAPDVRVRSFRAQLVRNIRSRPRCADRLRPAGAKRPQPSPEHPRLPTLSRCRRPRRARPPTGCGWTTGTSTRRGRHRPPRRRRARRPIPAPAIYGAVVLALVLLVVTIWAFGGFERRTDALIDTPVGTPVSTGPYEFRFTEVTAQRTKQFDGTIAWELTAIGTGRTTGNTSISPSATGKYGMFASKDDASGETAEADGDKIGTDDSYSRHAFTPGLAPIPYTVKFKYRETYRPGAHAALPGVQDRVRRLLAARRRPGVLAQHRVRLPVPAAGPRAAREHLLATAPAATAAAPGWACAWTCCGPAARSRRFDRHSAAAP